jgi:hypothetical protein
MLLWGARLIGRILREFFWTHEVRWGGLAGVVEGSAVEVEALMTDVLGRVKPKYSAWQPVAKER